MKRLFLTAAALAVLAVPATSRAGFVLELSAGSGFRWDPTPTERIPTNVMLAPGVSFAGMLKLELGLVANLADVKGSDFDIDLRPMIVIAPPIIPLYARGIFAVTNLANGPQKIQYGGALGMAFGLFGVGAFVEAGIVPRVVEVPTATGGKRDVTHKIAEGRVGVYWD